MNSHAQIMFPSLVFAGWIGVFAWIAVRFI